jgi:hypothetical protein
VDPRFFSGCFGREKDLLILPGFKTLLCGCPVHNLVSTLTALSRFVGKIITMFFCCTCVHF